jgi:hypothetical protein
MPLYRYKQPSVEHHNYIYGLKRKKYLSFRRFLILALLVVFAGFGFYFINRKNDPQIAAVTKQETFVPAPMPTEINANFMNQVNKCFLPTAAVYGYTLRITSGFRSLDEQEQIYLQGREINGHIVTEAPAGKSIHNYGYAIDVVDRYDAFDIDWDRLGRIGAYCGLEEGDEGDLPHFEHRAGLTTDEFLAGHRPPDLTLPCPVMEDKYSRSEALTLDDLKSCGAPNFNLDF